MNLKLRFQNKVTLIAMISATVTFVYQILGLLQIVPPINEDVTLQYFGILLNILYGLGVLVDPTTAGIGDSAQALEYTEPKE